MALNQIGTGRIDFDQILSFQVFSIIFRVLVPSIIAKSMLCH